MKKKYEKPVLVRRQYLAAVSALTPTASDFIDGSSSS